MRLYKMSEKDIVDAIQTPDLSDIEEHKIIAVKKFAGRFSGHPLKVVYEKTGKELFVITAYPLKKKSWR